MKIEIEMKRKDIYNLDFLSQFSNSDECQVSPAFGDNTIEQFIRSVNRRVKSGRSNEQEVH